MNPQDSEGKPPFQTGLCARISIFIFRALQSVFQLLLPEQMSFMQILLFFNEEAFIRINGMILPPPT